MQPHITINNTEHKVYINGYGTSQGAPQWQCSRQGKFADQGINNPEVRLQNFCTSLAAKRQTFNASRDYDTALAEYRKTYPWPMVVEMWTAQQNATRASLIVRSKSGDVVVAGAQTGSAPPCPLKITELDSGVPEPKSPPRDAFSYLSEHFFVVCLDDGDRYVTVKKVEGNRSDSKFGKDSPERRLLQKVKWADLIGLEADAEITAFFDANKVPGSLNGNAVVFWSGNSCLQADVTAEGLLKRDGFTRKVTQQIDNGISLWVPQAPPGAAEFRARARATVGEAGKNCYVVRQGSNTWVIPRAAAKKRQPTTRSGAWACPGTTSSGTTSPGDREPVR